MKCVVLLNTVLWQFFITKLSVYVDIGHTYCACCNTVLRIRIRDRVPFLPLDPPGSEIGFSKSRVLDSESQTHIFESLVTNFWVKKFYNSLKIVPNFFLQHFKNKIIYNFVTFIATKKGMTTNFFRPSLLLLFLDPGSRIRNPGSVMG